MVGTILFCTTLSVLAFMTMYSTFMELRESMAAGETMHINARV